jgi:hypothetical protein
VSEDDFGILHDLFTDGTADQTDEVTLQPTTSVKNDQIRKMVDESVCESDCECVCESIAESVCESVCESDCECVCESELQSVNHFHTNIQFDLHQ